MYLTANPHADYERYAEAQNAAAAAAEFDEMQAYNRLKVAFVEGLEWGEKHILDMPPKMPKRNTADALYELQDARPELIDRALCLLASLDDPRAKNIVDDMATAWAIEATNEWRKLSNR